MSTQQMARVLLGITVALFSTATVEANSDHSRLPTMKEIQAKQLPAHAEIVDGEILVEYKEDALPASIINARLGNSRQERREGVPPPSANDSNIRRGITRPPAVLPQVSKDPIAPLSQANDFSTKRNIAQLPIDQTLGPKSTISPAMRNQLLTSRRSTMVQISKDIHKRVPVTASRTYPIFGIQLMKVDATAKGKALNDIIASLRKESSIFKVTPNYKIYAESCSEDPPSNGLRCPPSDGHWQARHLWGMEKIGMQKAWGIGPTRETIVAVLDTGIDYEHPDLKQNIWIKPNTNNRGANFCKLTSTQEPTGYPMDRDGHGTMVAGIIAARGNNWDGTVTPDGDSNWLVNKSRTGLIGVNYKAKLMAIKVLCDSKDTRESSIALAIEAIEYARRHGATVINMSWGLSGIPEEELVIFKDAIAQSQQVLFVASAGNSRSDNDEHHHYPSNFNDLDNVIAVAATNLNDELWEDPPGGSGGSNWGKQKVDIAAPGTNILSTFLHTQDDVAGYEGAEPGTGTSLAAPHVSGCAALLLSKSLSTSSPLSPADLKNRLMPTGDSLASEFAPKIRSGRRLNCQNALSD